jgi:hypothetical protein
MPNMEGGIATNLEWAVVGAGLSVITVSLLIKQRIIQGIVAILTGGLTVLVCYSTIRRNLVGFNGPFLPTWAWYFTLICGGLLVCIGASDLLSTHVSSDRLKRHIP